MTAKDLPDDIIESIQANWGLSTRKEALVVADQLIQFLQALLEYAEENPEAFHNLDS